MCVPIIVTLPGLLGRRGFWLSRPTVRRWCWMAESDARARINAPTTFNDVHAAAHGQYLGPGLLGLGVDGDDRRFHVGYGRQTCRRSPPSGPTTSTRRCSDVTRTTATISRWAAGPRLSCVLISIAAAYALLWFSNILEFLQVLVFFFIVPLFGHGHPRHAVETCDAAGGFWGFLVAIVASMSMWTYVHTFPDGYRPQPKVTLSAGAVVRIQSEGGPDEGNHGRERGRGHAQRPNRTGRAAERPVASRRADCRRRWSLAAGHRSARRPER